MTNAPNTNDLIPQITRDDDAAGSGNLVRENVERLKALFPQIVTDGKVDFEVLRQLLGDEVEDGEERYGLNWKGKRRARAFAMTPSLGTLLPAPIESVAWETTQNIIIEGDNLEVLKLLRRSYAGKVKLIYIDPPYNTGTDFVYPDNYRNSIRNYLEITGQRGDEGEMLNSENETGGRRHTDWLNMIYPRLTIASEMLSDDGIILISIADEEISNLLQVTADIFGEERRAAIIHRRKNRKPHNAGETMSYSYEFIVAFYARKSFKLIQDYAEMKVDERGSYALYPVFKGDKKLRTYTFPAGVAVEGDSFRRGTIKAGRNANLDIEVLDDPIIVNGSLANAVRVTGRYCLTDENGMLSEAIADQNIYINANGFPKEKRRRSEEGGKIDNHHWDIDKGRNEDGDDEIKRLFGLKGDNNLFKYPKPVALLRKAIASTSTGDGDIVMDFFAGSGSTGHAVMAQNAEDGARRRFVLVQLPEQLEKSAKAQADAAALCDRMKVPSNIAELTKERLRRAGKAVEKDAKVSVDTGFRVYKLATSNLKPWQPDPDNLDASILDAVDNVLPGRDEEDLLVELLLKTGIDLTMPEEKRTISGQTVHAFGGGALMVCLGNIADGQAEELGQGMADWVDELDPTQTTVYFKDSGIGSDGNRAATKANLAAVLRQRLGDRIAKIASI